MDRDIAAVLKRIGAGDGDGRLAGRLEGYMRGILAWNEKINLTSVKDPSEFVYRHFLDSFMVSGLDEYRAAGRIADIGTGGGFPGVPLALLSPGKDFVLIDSVQKKLSVINKLCGSLGIANVKTVHGRAEDLGHEPQFREAFDLCVSRAVAGLPVLCEYCLPLVRVGGCFAAYKGPDPHREVKAAGRAIELLGGRVDRISVFDIPESGAADAPVMQHSLVLIRKTGKTQAGYPRKAGLPARKPLG